MQWVNWDLEGLSNLSKHSQLNSGRARSWKQLWREDSKTHMVIIILTASCGPEKWEEPRMEASSSSLHISEVKRTWGWVGGETGSLRHAVSEEGTWARTCSVHVLENAKNVFFLWDLWGLFMILKVYTIFLCCLVKNPWIVSKELWTRSMNRGWMCLRGSAHAAMDQGVCLALKWWGWQLRSKELGQRRRQMVREEWGFWTDEPL